MFDHAWANAFHHFGGSYYPKLQSCVPFTPVTGPRILLRNHPLRDTVADGILQSMQDLAHQVSFVYSCWVTLLMFQIGIIMHNCICYQFKVSSLHVTFPTEEQWKKMGDAGFLQRVGMQYHWLNHDYKRCG